MSVIIFTELVLYIEETMHDEESAPVIKLTDLVQLYQSKMENLEVRTDTRVHFIRFKHILRFKHRLLVQFPDMHAHNKGRGVLMVFEEDVVASLDTACGQDCNSEAVHLSLAAQIVWHQMFREAKPFNGFPERCQEESVPSLLLGRRLNPCSTCSSPNIEVQQHRAQVDTWHVISQRQAQHCTGDKSSNIYDVAYSHTQRVPRQAVTPGYYHIV